MLVNLKKLKQNLREKEQQEKKVEKTDDTQLELELDPIKEKYPHY